MNKLAHALVACLVGSPALAQQEINLPEALRNEAQVIYQLLVNVAPQDFRQTDVPWGYGPTWPDYPATWPAPNQVTYNLRRPSERRTAFNIELVDIYVRDLGQIEWSEEREIRPIRDSDRRWPVNIAAGDTLTQTFSHTFSHATTLEEETKINLAAEVELSLGNLESPAGAKLTTKVETEFASKFSDTATVSDTLSQQLVIQGPANRVYFAFRDRVIAERTTRCRPLFDYKIRFAARYDDGGYLIAEWASKAEFERFIRGLADDTVGYLNASNPYMAKALAPFYRAHPQPGASIGDSAPPMEWTDRYSTRIVTGIDFEEAAKSQ